MSAKPESLKNISNWLALLIILIGLAAAFACGWQRLTIERSHKQVEIAIEWSQLAEAARRENISLEAALAGFGERITAVVYKEPIFIDLQNDHRLTLKSGEQLLWDFRDNPELPFAIQKEYNYLLFPALSDARRVLEQLSLKMPDAYIELNEYKGTYFVATSLGNLDLYGLGLGFAAEELAIINSLGLRIVPQIRFWPEASLASVNTVLDSLAGYDLAALGFNDLDIPGNDLNAAAQKEVRQAWLDGAKRLGAPLLYVELFAQKGLPAMALDMDNDVVRLHAISEKEMLTFTPDKAINRFQLAVSERGIKIIMVRFLPQKDLAANRDFLGRIQESLVNKGTTPGPLKTPEPLHPNRLLLILMVGSVMAATWLIGKKFQLGRWAGLLAAVVLLAGAFLLLSGRIGYLQKIFALGAAVIFPTLSVLTFLPREKQSLFKALGLFLLTTLGSLAGALLVVGFLADGNYMLALKIFSGVKIADILPIVLLFVFLLFFGREKEWSSQRLKGILEIEIKVKHALIFFLAAGIVVFYLMRSGNDNMAISDLERNFRTYLDLFLGVRPRTKEFLLHPLLLLSCYWGYKDRYLPLVLLGGIAQVSLVNTFAHIHTPLIISLKRTFNGLWLGVLIGLLLFAGIVLLIRLYEKRKRGSNL